MQAAAWDAAWAEMEALRRGDDEAALRCADGFLALHIELPYEHPRAVVALDNAAQCQAAAGPWDDAARLYLRIVAGWPDSELVPRALAELALGHEAVGRYAESADFAEQFATRATGSYSLPTSPKSTCATCPGAVSTGIATASARGPCSAPGPGTCACSPRDCP